MILMQKILIKKNLMNKIKYRMCFAFIYLMPGTIHPYILRKKVIIFKVTLVALSDFKSF